MAGVYVRVQMWTFAVLATLSCAVIVENKQEMDCSSSQYTCLHRADRNNIEWGLLTHHEQQLQAQQAPNNHWVPSLGPVKLSYSGQM